MLIENGNKKNLDSLENVKRIMIKGKIKQSISLFGVKQCQKREISMFVVVFNSNVLSSNSSSNSYLRQHWSKGKNWTYSLVLLG